MAAKPLTTEAIVLHEKKMDMALDDIIKMSKDKPSKTGKQQRVSNKSQKNFKNAAQQKSFKVRQYMDSRSSLRQGVLAQRRSSFQANQFPLATEVAQKAASGFIRNRWFNHNTAPASNKRRVGAFMGRRATYSDVSSEQAGEKQQQGISGFNQRPQTLDSLFANMHEERMRVLSSQNNATRRNGGGKHRLPLPLVRNRFVN